MSDKRANLEIIAPSVEEAVAKGLNELGLSQNQVEVEVLDEGSRGGLFGLGARQARIRLTIKTVTAPPAPQVEPAAPTSLAAPTPPVAQTEVVEEEAPLEAVDEDELLQAARQTVETLLSHMQITATINVQYGEQDESHSKPPVLVDIQGKDLTILIGKKAEVLNALQYISSLILSKQMGRTVTLVVDVEKYRERRQQQIRQIALRMADQAVKTGRRQSLEPMPASERRLVHMALRDNADVRTESTGEDPYRKVVIVPVD